MKYFCLQIIDILWFCLFIFRQLEYTRESLLEFKKAHEAKELAAKKGSNTGFGGFGGDGEANKVNIHF